MQLFTKKDLVWLVIPLIIEQTLSATIGVVDTLMVAGVGEAAVSAVSLVDSINLLLLQVFTALATGGAIVVAQYIGKEEDDNARVAAKQLLIVVTAMSLVIMLIGVFGRHAILQTLYGQADPLVMQHAVPYFWIGALSYPMVAIYSSCAALFRAQGNSRISMFAALVMNVIHIALNALFIYGMQMGVVGAAISTLISRAAAAVFLLVLLTNSQNRVYLETLRPLRLEMNMVKNILRLGIPNGLENGIFQIGKILVQGLVTSFGTMALAANAVCNSVMSMSQIPGAAIGMALITVVGQCVGAQDYKGAKKYIIQLTGMAYLLLGALNLILMLTIRPIVGFFDLTPQTAELAIHIAFWCAAADIVIWPLSFTLPNGLRAASDMTFVMVVAISSMWLCRIGLSYVFGEWLQMGLFGVWLAMWVDWVVRASAFCWRFFSGKWQNVRSVSSVS